MMTAAAWPIMACARMNEIQRRALQGDPIAVQILIAAAPDDLPRQILEVERDRRIGEAGAWLHTRLPQAKPYRIARIISAAIAVVSQRGRSLGASPPFDALSHEERVELESRAREILAWAPARLPGISVRSIIDVLQN